MNGPPHLEEGFAERKVTARGADGGQIPNETRLEIAAKMLLPIQGNVGTLVKRSLSEMP
jgi:hypothetical protein